MFNQEKEQVRIGKNEFLPNVFTSSFEFLVQCAERRSEGKKASDTEDF